MTASTVPFGARAPIPTYSVHIDPDTFHYDTERQVNLTGDGRLWADEPIAASSTATNNDTRPGNPPDEGADPYVIPEPEPTGVPHGHALVKASV